MNTFEAEFMRLGGPEDMGMFNEQDPGHDFTAYYLSPGVEQRAPHLLRIFGANDCATPCDSVVIMVAVTDKKPSHY
ncbi:MAG TPA: hypothetical protein VK727_18220 [Steroidobacteraceae bacterium]|nr:hypothetical protein [Steroidobacteraceae bacterium]